MDSVQLTSVSPDFTPRRLMFGDVAFNKVYHLAKDRVIGRNMLRLYQKVHLRRGFVTIIICNLWRIDRSLCSPDVETLLWDFESDSWQPSLCNYKVWPFISLLPIHRVSSPSRKEQQSLSDALTVLRHALKYVLDQSGFQKLPRNKSSLLEEAFLRQQLGVKTSRSRFQLDHRRAGAAMRALRKNLWVEVIDQKVLSLTSSMVGYRARIGLTDYLRCASHWTGLKRVALEHRNCVPLLQDIAPRHWARPDLFSRNLWVTGTRKTTLIDRRGFMCRDCYDSPQYLSSLQSKADFRWLVQAPTSVLNHLKGRLKTSGQPHMPRWVRLLRLTQPPSRIPSFAMVIAIDAISLHRLSPENPCDVRLLRTWLCECSRLWQEEGFSVFRQSMRLRDPNSLSNQLRHAMDWFRDVGRAAGLPGKQMGWEAIKHHSDIYHQQLMQEGEGPRGRRNERQLSWTAPVQRLEADGLKADALLSSAGLREEGQRMHHCVGGYDNRCAEGEYLVYALSTAEGSDRATLGLRVQRTGKVAVDQLFGPCNQEASTTFHKFARVIVKEINSVAILENAA